MIFNFIFTLTIIINISLSLAHFDQLNDYDVIPVPQFRVKRGIRSDSKQIEFKTKFRNFKVRLNPNEELFTNDFRAYSVDKVGNKENIMVNSHQFYTGFVSEEYGSSVKANFNPDGSLSMNIMTDNDIYQIEPMSRQNNDSDSLIVYRYSDLKNNYTTSSKCKPMTVPSNSTVKSREKRQVIQRSIGYVGPNPPSNSNRKFCTIKLVADYRFHLKHGRGEKTRTVNYLIELLDNINQLYKKTTFLDFQGEKYEGYGFVIKDIQVHIEPTQNSPGHYNEYRPDESDVWKINDLLYSFGSHDYRDFCLAHLFTYQSFREGTLGLAWIATYLDQGQGGICSSRIYHERDHNQLLSVNTAWSTFKDAAGNPLVSLSAYLVTAHELGHNWGTDHDPDNLECAPRAANGGKYIMYTYSVVGYELNNRIFSPCSRNNIGATIARRGKTCFRAINELNQVAYCGNRRVDFDEQCDVGSDLTVPDLCCNSTTCQLNQGAQCSPKNYQCCTSGCQIRPQGYICQQADSLSPCLGKAVCNGMSSVCLPPEPLTGPTCTEHGKCNNGQCQPFCEQIGLTACICDNVEESCEICCKYPSNNNSTRTTPVSSSNDKTVGECRPSYLFAEAKQKGRLLLNEGRPCVQGVCEQGKCKRKINKLVERIWKIIEKFDSNAFAAILLDNLVGAVIIMSLVIWIPGCLLVRYYDILESRRNQNNANMNLGS